MASRWRPGADPTVGVVGEPPSAVRSAVDGIATLVSGTLEELQEATVDCLAITDDAGLQAVADGTVSSPVVYVPETDPDRLGEIVRSGATEHEQPILAVETPDEGIVRAISEVALVAREPARLSEYRIEAGPETLDQLRADGIVAATPLGCERYAGRVGAPTVSPAAEALAVTPMAPFRLDNPRWVTPPTLSLTVCRNEDVVGVWVDGADRGRVREGESVVLEPVDRLRTLV